jgi:hypothetical protein
MRAIIAPAILTMTMSTVAVALAAAQNGAGDQEKGSTGWSGGQGTKPARAPAHPAIRSIPRPAKRSTFTTNKKRVTSLLLRQAKASTARRCSFRRAKRRNEDNGTFSSFSPRSAAWTNGSIHKARTSAPTNRGLTCPNMVSRSPISTASGSGRHGAFPPPTTATPYGRRCLWS